MPSTKIYKKNQTRNCIGSCLEEHHIERNLKEKLNQKNKTGVLLLFQIQQFSTNSVYQVQESPN